MRYIRYLINRLFYSLNNSVEIARELTATRYLSGDGIEIGALHNPLSVPKHVNVQYVDRMTVPELKKQYPELSKYKLVDVDIIDDGEYLHNIEDRSQDFIIANHFIEHCENPISTILNMLRVLKDEGVIYIAVPDKMYNSDKIRKNTSFEHLMNDYKNGPLATKEEHFKEWVCSWNKIENREEANKRVEYLMSIDYSIHYHVWTSDTFIAFLIRLRQELSIGFEVDFFSQNKDECITILRKLTA